jgi:hypothetical protein
MRFEKFSPEMRKQAEVNEEKFAALCPRAGSLRLNFLWGKELHSATIQFEDGEEVLIYDGILEL